MISAPQSFFSFQTSKSDLDLASVRPSVRPSLILLSSSLSVCLRERGNAKLKSLPSLLFCLGHPSNPLAPLFHAAGECVCVCYSKTWTKRYLISFTAKRRYAIFKEGLTKPAPLVFIQYPPICPHFTVNTHTQRLLEFSITISFLPSHSPDQPLSSLACRATYLIPRHCLT